MSKRKVNSLIQEITKEISISGPSPDEELVTLGQSMFWSPDSMKMKDYIKVENNDDLMLSIL